MSTRRLYRCRSDRKIAGVAAGMAEYLEVDPTVVRVAWILSAFIGGFTILLYVILAFIIPLEPVGMPAPAYGAGPQFGADGPAPEPGAEASLGHVHDHVSDEHRARGRSGGAGIVFGVLLVVFGAIALAGQLFPGWVAHSALGPAFVLALGVALLAGAARRPAVEE